MFCPRSPTREAELKLEPGLHNRKSLLNFEVQEPLKTLFYPFLRKGQELIEGKAGNKQYMISLYSEQLKYGGMIC